MAKPQLAVFLLFFALYLLTSGGHTYSTDEESMFFVAAAMARRGDADVPSQSDAPVTQHPQGRNGKYYASFGVFQSAAALPLYYVGSALSLYFPRFYSGYILRFPIAFILDPLYTALTAMLLFRAVLLLGYRFRIALLTVLCYGLGTFAWVYSKTYFSDPLVALFLLAAVVLLLRYKLEPRNRFVLASGVVLGLAVLTKIVTASVLPVFFAYLVYLLYRRRNDVPRRALFVPILLWGGAVAAAFAIVGTYNWLRFGDPLQTGYVGGVDMFSFALLEGLYGQLLSPGKSVFLYAPILLLTIPGTWLFARRHLPEALFYLGITAMFLFVNSLFRYWHGDTAWGPRFMVFVLPLLTLPLAEVFVWLAQPGRAVWRGLVAALLVVSVFVQLLGVLVNFDIYPNQVTSEQRYYEPQLSPLVAHARLLAEAVTNTKPIPPMPEGSIARFGWFFNPYEVHPFDLWFVYAARSGMELPYVFALTAPLLLLCLAGLMWSVRALWRLWQSDAPRHPANSPLGLHHANG